MNQIYNVARSVELATMECPNCTAVYAISQKYLDEARERGGFQMVWTCPYCKAERGYGEGTADKLRKDLDEAQRKLSAAKCETANERVARELAERELSRHKTRTKNGVCPCCKRSFQNLRRHIASKHPSFKTP